MTSIDPRLRQRRVAVRRAAGRRRLRLLLVALAIVVAAALAYGVTRSALFDVDRIKVQGVAETRAEEVRTATGIELGAPLLDVDLGSARDAVTALPWVRSAQVERSWPGSVNVVVASRVAVASLVSSDGGLATVDEEGVATAFEDQASPEGHPRIIVRSSDEVGAVRLGEIQTLALPAIDLVLAVPEDLDAWVAGYVVEYRGVAPQLSLELVGGAIADLGDHDNLTAKLEGVRSVIDQVDRRCLAVIDASVGGIPTVRRDADCEAQLADNQ